MNYGRWATFLLSLFEDDGVVFDWLVQDMLEKRSKLPIDPKLAREIADRHFFLITKKTFKELATALAAIERFGIQIPKDRPINKANRDWYAELLWTNQPTLLEKQIDDNFYFIGVEQCTHLPAYSQIRKLYGNEVHKLEVAATEILDSLGQNIPETSATKKLAAVLEDLDVSWPHLVNRVRANGPCIFSDGQSAPTAKVVLDRLLVAEEQSLPVQLMLWPTAKLHSEIQARRDRAKLDKEPVVHFTNGEAPVNNSPRGYVARSWKNRWRKDY